MMKLGVFWPWDSPFTFTGFTENVLQLERPPGWEVNFFQGKGWCSSRRHADGYEKALKWGADLILCIGSDQTYPVDLLPRLVARHEETHGGMITCLVPFRGYVPGQGMKPFQPLAWRLAGDGIRQFRGIDQDGDMMRQIDPADGDLQRVHFIGTGVLLIHREHILRLKRPWLYDQVQRETLQLASDCDAKFIWRLQIEAHAQLWVDTTIKIKHLHVFSIDETFQDRFEDWSEQGGDENIVAHGRPVHQENEQKNDSSDGDNPSDGQSRRA